MERVYSAIFTPSKDGTSSTRFTCAQCQRNSDVLPVRCQMCDGVRYCSSACREAGREVHKHFCSNARATANPSGDRQLCSHTSCLDNALTRLGRGFVAAYGIRGLTGVVLSIARRWGRLGWRDIARPLLSTNTLSFGSFVALMVAINSGVRCALVRLRHKDDKINTAVAGGLAGLSLFVDHPSRRTSVALYFAVRAIYAAVHSLLRHGKVQRVGHMSSVLFGIVNAPIMYGFLTKPALLDPTYYRWILNISDLSDTAIQYTFRDLLGTGQPIRACTDLYHPGESCTAAGVRSLVNGFFTGMKFYLPIHLIPKLLFQPNKFMRSPADSMLSVADSVRQSAMFLGSYILIARYSMCALRHARGTEDWWHTPIIGMATGLACMFENSKRVSELMLYCAPHAIMVLFGEARDQKLVSPIKHGEVLLFCAALALMNSLDREDFKPAYQSVMSFLFGIDPVVDPRIRAAS